MTGTVIEAFSDFSGVVWTENISDVFRVKTPFSNLHYISFKQVKITEIWENISEKHLYTLPYKINLLKQSFSKR